MVDIETLSLARNAAVWAVAIQPFHFTQFGCHPNDKGVWFYMDPLEQAMRVRVGRAHESQDTIAWTLSHGDAKHFEPWMERYQRPEGQSAEGVQSALIGGNGGVLIIRELQEKLCTMIDRETLVWCKGKEFDIAIIENMFYDLDLKTPWHYRNTMCMRTAGGLLRAFGGEEVKPAVTHNAMEDAKSQVYLLDAHILRLYGMMQQAFGAVDADASVPMGGAPSET